MNTDIAAVEHRSTPSHSGANTMHTMQRFLESIKWDEEKLRDRCQQIVAKEHAHREAMGCVDESGTAKSGKETVGASRQWNGNRGKVNNCVVGVHISYSAPDFQVLLDSALYLPTSWANDPARGHHSQPQSVRPRVEYQRHSSRSQPLTHPMPRVDNRLLCSIQSQCHSCITSVTKKPF